MSARIVTVGHIRCLNHLKTRGKVLIGLLTDGAMKGYKDPIVPFKDRKTILRIIARGYKNVKVVSQQSLDPSHNLKKYKPNYIASGDGFEQCEIDAAKKYKVKLLNITLPKNYSSSAIIKKCIKQY